MSALNKIIPSDGPETRGINSLKRVMSGVGGKVVALAVLPVVLMAGLNVFSMTQSFGVFSESFEIRNVSDAAREAIVHANDAVKDEMLSLVQDTNAMLKVHQSSLLMKNSGLIEQTFNARGKAGEEIDVFRANIRELSASLEGAGLVRSNAEAEGESELQAESRRRLNIVRRVAETLPPLFEMFVDSNNRTLALIKDENFAAATANFAFEETQRLGIVNKSLLKIGANLELLSSTIEQSLQLSREADTQSAMEELNSLSIFSYSLLVIIAVLLIASAAWYAVFRLATPLKGMSDAMRQLSSGDTSFEVPSRERLDEIGEMAGAVQVFKENAIETTRLAAAQADEQAGKAKRAEYIQTLSSKFDVEAAEMLDAVSAASAEMRATAQSMTGTAEQASKQTEAVSNASDSASSNVQTVAAATEELSASISEITRQVNQSTQIAGRAVTEAERVSGTVSGLSEAAQKIGDVVNLIQEIAEQTNLLALNATIEAARAGDAGKGFAVVASEVKSLANQTAKATSDIAAQISNIQAATSETVDAIGGVRQVIDQIGENTASISSAVDEQNSATSEISRNVQEAARGTSEVTDGMSGVKQASSDTGSAAGQVLGAADALSQQSDQLKSKVQEFLDNLKAA
ncbi:methyl-accepting chemotaxis protein [Pelagibius sp. Alg239-R121]|uniref:methyl-accepting chemotaxis protein n=1 Tax=Pelagibius sp. Alg239-R121 TaxID=2993448 RepID=UPI0024A78978|nr:methyl-accepting chemotaxis protein [Pelagibius sp. Alg239-R121]